LDHGGFKLLNLSGANKNKIDTKNCDMVAVTGEAYLHHLPIVTCWGEIVGGANNFTGPYKFIVTKIFSATRFYIK
jgi:hypothetical protein